MSKLKKKQSSESLMRAISFLKIDMSMQELGEKLNYSKAAVSKYLSGFPPSKAFLNKFEQEFGVVLSHFDVDSPLYKEEIHPGLESKNNPFPESDNETLKELVKELRERVVDLKKSLEEAREAKHYFKDEFEKLNNKD